jgi:hypothetical protein
MPTFRISATGEGGKTVAEATIDRPTRDEALIQGTAQLLADQTFPPEALEIFRRGIAGGFMYGEVCDTLTEKFHIQFFIAPTTETPAVRPVEERVAQAQPRAPERQHDPIGPQFPIIASNGRNLSPRELLQWEMKELNNQLRNAEQNFRDVKKQRDFIRKRRNECRELLKTKPKKPAVVRAVRKGAEQHG